MLDPKVRELIGIGASIAAGCQPCLEKHTIEAKKAGADDTDIRTAIRIAQAVRDAASECVDKFAIETIGPEGECGGGCCCGH